MLSVFWSFVAKLLTVTLSQFLSIFGIFIVFGLILYALSRFTRHLFVNGLGEKSDVYFTGWLGTPIHELGHAIFCIPFLHKIVDMRIFMPNSKEGTLGYVSHTYNPRNPWAQIGNFFIAIGPIIFGSFVIYLLVRYLLPNNSQTLLILNGAPAYLASMSGFCNLLTQILGSSLNLLASLFASGNTQHWQFWLFLYLCICISSHMELSVPDLKGVWQGLLWILLILLFVNMIFMLITGSGATWLAPIGNFTNLLTGLFTLSVSVSVLNCAFCFVILNIVSLIVKRKFLI